MLAPERAKLTLGITLGVLVASLWSGWMVVSRYGATHDLTVPDITFLRFLAAGLVTLPFFVLRWHEIRRIGWRGLLIMGAFGGVPYSLMSVAGMALAPAAQAGRDDERPDGPCSATALAAAKASSAATEGPKGFSLEANLMTRVRPSSRWSSSIGFPGT